MLIFPSFFNAAAGGYEIEQSLRFDGSSYLSRSPSTTGSRRKLTFSGWVKDDVPSSPAHAAIFAASSGTSYEVMSRDYGRHLYFVIGSPTKGETQPTNYLLRDASAWYHFVFTLDSEAASSDDRMRLYINGTQTYVNNTNVLEQDADTTYFNVSGITHYVGMLYSSVWNWKGYMAECNYVDGQALEPDSFGEFDNNGVWRPKRYTGSYGTNGFYLKFDPSATNGIGHDHSGNGNNWTPTGFDTTNSTASTYDVMSDTPTNNFATLNPLLYSNSNSTYSEGNLKVTSSSNWTAISTIPFPQTGKFYIEVTTDGVTEGYPTVGIADVTTNFNNGGYNFANSVGLRPRYNDSNKPWWFKDGTDVTARISDTAVSTGDIFQCIYDADNNKVWFGINNTYYGLNGSTSTTVSASDIASGTNPAKTLTSSDTYILQVCPYPSAGATVNFGQRAFAYTPPTGFKPLNTANLAAPTVKDGSEYFDTLTYTGDGLTPKEINGLGFQPDFVWIKDRLASTDHILTDAVRGATKNLATNSTAVENTDAQNLQSFDDDGFTIGNGSQVNLSSGRTYVAWNWKEGATPGFDIATHTNTNDSTVISHSLGVAPEFIISKARDSSATQWRAHHVSGGVSQTLILSTDQGFVASGERVTAVSSSTFTYDATVTPNGTNFIHYLWSGVEGYSKFGSYTGNGSSDGPFVYCGFKPAWVMVKRSSTSETGWIIIDNTRDDYNPGNHELNAENSQAELTAYERFDLLSNGFKQRSTYGANNLSGGTYIYAAFAENPFGGSGVSPATAR